MFTMNKGIEGLICEKEGEIDRIIINCECKNLEEAIDYYKDIYNINDDLMQNV